MSPDVPYEARTLLNLHLQVSLTMHKLRGGLSIIMGLVMIIGGATGQLVARGTESTIGAVAIGVLILGIGIYRVTRE
jgi:hypothetical protein